MVNTTYGEVTLKITYRIPHFNVESLIEKIERMSDVIEVEEIEE